MNQVNDPLAAESITRHCTDPECRKCRARGRWMRRKAWRSASPRTALAAPGRGDAE